MTDEDKAPTEPNPMKAWELCYQHLRRGHDNAQQTIRAMDTKTSILTGLSIFALTAIAGIVKTLCDSCSTYSAIAAPVATFALIRTLLVILPFVVALVLATTSGISCIVLCIKTLVARSRNDTLTTLPTTVLFPYLPPRDKASEEKYKAAVQYYDKIRNREITEQLILDEYHDQVLNIGRILGEKIFWNRKAVQRFKQQVVSTGVALLLVAPALFSLCSILEKAGKEQLPTVSTTLSVSRTGGVTSTSSIISGGIPVKTGIVAP